MMNDVNVFKHVDCDARSPYHYTECGLSNIWLVSGYEEEEYDGECYISIKDADALHHAIALHLVRQKSELKGEQVRFLRKEMDLRQTDLASLVNVSPQTVARWEKDQTEVPGPVNVLLRIIAMDHLTGEVDVIELAKELQQLDDEDGSPLTMQFDKKEGWHSSAILAA